MLQPPARPGSPRGHAVDEMPLDRAVHAHCHPVAKRTRACSLSSMGNHFYLELVLARPNNQKPRLRVRFMNPRYFLIGVEP